MAISVWQHMDNLMLNKETDWGFLPESVRDKIEWKTYKTKKDQWEFDSVTNLMVSIALAIEECPDGMREYTLAAKAIQAHMEGI